ncbi:MAG: ComEA family DNA-binding protein [Desulfobacterales bacterium]
MGLKRFIAIFAALLVMFAFIVPVFGQDTERVNINKASAQELAKLQKVGPKFAVRIIEYRQKYGPFKLTEELMEIRGIGPHTYDRIKDKITVQ